MQYQINTHKHNSSVLLIILGINVLLANFKLTILHFNWVPQIKQHS